MHSYVIHTAGYNTVRRGAEQSHSVSVDQTVDLQNYTSRVKNFRINFLADEVTSVIHQTHDQN